MTARYPVSLDVEGRPCVVLGGDEVAREKVEGLLRAGARVSIFSEEVCDGLGALAESRVVAWVPRPPEAGDLAGAWLAVDASGDEEVNRVMWEEAEREGVLLNVVDRPRRCHFTAPALVRRGALQIAISTSGESPHVASALRARLERLVGEEWAPFVSLVGRIRRRLRARGVPSAQQAVVYAELLRSDVRRLLRDGRRETAEFQAAAVAERVGEATPGRVTLVGTGPGDPGLLTLRGFDVLSGADIVFHDALVDPQMLALSGPGAQLVDVGKRGGRENPAQEEITRQMVEAARAGLEVVRLKGGDPFIFGRGGEEVAAVVAAGIDVAVVPGVSSAAAAPAVAGIPLTLRGVASSVAFISGQPRDRGDGDGERLASIARAVDTLVILMPLTGLEGLSGHLAEVRGGEHPAALVCRATLPDERVIRSTVGSIALTARQAGAEAPATLIVGDVVASGEELGGVPLTAVTG